MSKTIGGYCKTRFKLIEVLEDLRQDQQYELSEKERECLYSCDGWAYQKDCYKGEDINLKGK